MSHCKGQHLWSRDPQPVFARGPDCAAPTDRSISSASTSEPRSRRKRRSASSASRGGKVLDEEIRPSVAMDGGDVIFAGFEDGVVEVYLQGACQGCPSASATLRFGIEARLKEEVPEVTSVISV